MKKNLKISYDEECLLALKINQDILEKEKKSMLDCLMELISKKVDPESNEWDAIILKHFPDPRKALKL